MGVLALPGDLGRHHRAPCSTVDADARAWRAGRQERQALDRAAATDCRLAWERDRADGQVSAGARSKRGARDVARARRHGVVVPRDAPAYRSPQRAAALPAAPPGHRLASNAAGAASLPCRLLNRERLLERLLAQVVPDSAAAPARLPSQFHRAPPHLHARLPHHASAGTPTLLAQIVWRSTLSLTPTICLSLSPVAPHTLTLQVRHPLATIASCVRGFCDGGMPNATPNALVRKVLAVTQNLNSNRYRHTNPTLKAACSPGDTRAPSCVILLRLAMPPDSQPCPALAPHRASHPHQVGALVPSVPSDDSASCASIFAAFWSDDDRSPTACAWRLATLTRSPSHVHSLPPPLT